MSIEQARKRIGSKVVRRTAAGVEEGVITSVNNSFVFVRYGSDHNSKATVPGELEPLRH